MTAIQVVWVLFQSEQETRMQQFRLITLDHQTGFHYRAFLTKNLSLRKVFWWFDLIFLIFFVLIEIWIQQFPNRPPQQYLF